MFRYFAAFASPLFLAVALTAADAPQKVTIRWHGQSFFEIESSKGTRIVIDPHAIEAYGRKSVPADLVLITHLHTDHTQLGAVKTQPKTKIHFGLRGAANKA